MWWSRLRDPKFDVVRFLGKTKETIPVILGAYLRGDSATLKSLGVVGDEMLERMQGQMSVWKKEGEVCSLHQLATPFPVVVHTVRRPCAAVSVSPCNTHAESTRCQLHATMVATQHANNARVSLLCSIRPDTNILQFKAIRRPQLFPIIMMSVIMATRGSTTGT